MKKRTKYDGERRRVRLKESILITIWLSILAFPMMVVRVNSIEKQVEWRWGNMLYLAGAVFFLALVWGYFLEKRGARGQRGGGGGEAAKPFSQRLVEERAVYRPLLLFLFLFFLISPFVFSTYNTNVMTTALMYVVLGLGLNIIVGLTGLLNLGYVAFYAAGAYCYALLNHHFGVGFWTALPLGALAGAFFGLLLGLPVMRLRGDYLAIVTLGFGEIVRLVLENWNAFSFGPSGISRIPPPGLFGLHLGVRGVTVYLYFLMVGICLLTIFVVRRLQDSRIGRAWVAVREDEAASESMGVNASRAKLAAFAIGAGWAGMMGVVLAAKTTFINPASFTFLESAMVLSIVVLGGIGSVPGIALAAFLLILLPEYMRAFSDYRMLSFGAAMVVMMIFRPQGIIPYVRRTYEFPDGEACGKHG